MIHDAVGGVGGVDTAVDRAWSLITVSEHRGPWFGAACADICRRAVGALEVRWEGHERTGVVEAVEPTSRFAFRWRQLDTPVGVTLAEGNSTLVEFSLASEGGATRVRMVESGFGALPISDEDRNDLFKAHAEGWPRELGDLETYAAGVAA